MHREDFSSEWYPQMSQESFNEKKVEWILQLLSSNAKNMY